MLRFALSKPPVVLVVEDEPLIREAAAEILRDNGFDTIEAEDADEAVIILERRADIRIVFTDIEMPGSMDGIKLARAIRNRWPPIQVVLTSASLNVPLAEFPDDCLFLPKPYKFQHVVLTMQSLTS